MVNCFNKKTIFITAGGTGGHVFPAVSVAKELLSREYKVHFITDNRGLKFIPENFNARVHFLPLRGLGKSGLFNKIIGIISLIPSLLFSFYYFISYKPEYVIGFGGYPSFPCLLIAKLIKIPFWIQEQNAFFGKVNKWFSSSAEGIALGFKETKGLNENIEHKSHFIGIPVRKEISNLSKIPFRFNNKQKLKIVVLGGSQGASIFSKIIPKALEMLTKNEINCFEITQQCRKEDIEFVNKKYESFNIKYKIESFIKNIEEELVDSGLIISRSGASTTGEVISSKRPALFIPLSIASDDHQYFNAKYIDEHFGGWVVRENNFTPEMLSVFLKKCLLSNGLLFNAHVSLFDLDFKNPEKVFCDIISEKLY